MPLIDVQVLEGVYSDEEKSRIIEKLTQAFGEIAGRTMAEATSVRIHEIRSGSWGYAGKPMTTEDGLAMRKRG